MIYMITEQGKKSAFEAVRSIEQAIPFKIKKFDSNNGGKFINFRKNLMT